MKENNEVINHSIFTHDPALQAKQQILRVWRKIAQGWKQHLADTLAAAGIATLTFISIYLFFVQLAENGWQ